MYFWMFSIIISPIEEQKMEYTLTTSRVGGSILKDRPPGNWHPDGVPTGAPANAWWWSCASMVSFQASSPIEYFSSGMIGQGVFVNTIASLNRFVTSKVAFWQWGISWSALAFCWGTLWSPPALGSGRACTTSGLRDMLIADFWSLSNGGAQAPTGYRRFGCGLGAITGSAWLHFFGSGTLVVRVVLLQHAWSRWRTACRMSKSSPSISDDKVDSPGHSVLSLLISGLVSSSFCFIRSIRLTLAIFNTILECWVGCSNIWLAIKIGCVLQCMCKCSPKVCFLLILWIVIPHLAGRRLQAWWSEVGNVEWSI